MRLIRVLASLGVLLIGSAHAAEKPSVMHYLELYERTVFLPAEKKAECAALLRSELERVEAASIPRSLLPVDTLLHERGCLDDYSWLHPSFDRIDGLLPEGVSIKVMGDALYVRIESFLAGAKDRFNEAFKRLPSEWRRRATLTVLDLRNNKGGSLHDLRDILNLYFAPSPGVTYMAINTSSEWPPLQTSTERGALADLPIAILVDKNTASAAEWMAASLRYELAKDTSVIIGEQTYGKAIIQCRRPEIFGGKELIIKATCGEWTVQGKKIQGVGLQPDLLIGSACTQDDECLRARLLKD